MMERGEQYDAFARALEDFKRRHLPYDSDEPPPILHRKDIINARGAFYRLQDAKRREAFNADLLDLIRRTPFTLIGVVIDKLTHGRAYYRVLQHPYHYCLLAMLERYCGLLQRQGHTGDLMVESRGGSEDRAFEDAYTDLYERGRGYLTAAQAKATLTSRKPKLKKKEENIAGLQLADLFAHTVMRDVLFQEKRVTTIGAAPFAGQIAKAVEGKYNRHLWWRTIRGWGRVLLK
jgi:hypothetical protein